MVPAIDVFHTSFFSFWIMLLIHIFLMSFGAVVCALICRTWGEASDETDTARTIMRLGVEPRRIAKFKAWAKHITFYEILIGMKTTSNHLLYYQPVTFQYPHEKRVLPDNYQRRGENRHMDEWWRISHCDLGPGHLTYGWTPWPPRLPSSSKILPHPHDPAQDTVLVCHGEVFIQLIEWMKYGLPADFLKLSQEGPLRAAILTIDHHILTRLTLKIRVDENDLALAEKRLHGVVSHLHGKRTYPRDVCFEHRFSLDDTRPLFWHDHLIDLIPSQEWHLPHLAEGRGSSALCEVEQSL